MERDGEWSNEIPNASYFDLLQQYQQGLSPASRVTLQSVNSLPSPSRDGFCLSDDISPYSSSFEGSRYETPSYHLRMDSKSPDSGNNFNEKLVDELGLSQNFYRMKISNDVNDDRGIMSCLGGNVHYQIGKYATWNGFDNGVLDSEGFRLSSGLSVDEDLNSTLLNGRGGGMRGDSFGSFLARNQDGNLCSDSHCSCGRGFQLQNPLSSRPYIHGAFGGSKQCEMNSLGDTGVKSNTRTIQKDLNGRIVPQCLASMKCAGDIEAFNCEESLIIQGNNLKHIINREKDMSKGSKKHSCNEIVIGNPQETNSLPESPSWYGGICENVRRPSSFCPSQTLLSTTSLAEVQGYIYAMAQDQNGCRFLQRMFDEGTSQDVQIILDEVIDHVVELTMKPFGNYLVQKLLDVCNEGQRMQILLMVAREPGQLVRISLNTYGTRVVQKLIETLKSRQQILLVISALKPGVLDLIMDLNGNHVIQRCLQCLSNEENKFIFETAAKFSVDIATHRHGCCVLQRCIAHSTGKYQDKLITEISKNGLLLAQDPFGNYVIQYIIELKNPAAFAILISQFSGQYVQLSMQKFGSHVVEKCLKHFADSRSKIVHELLSVSHFDRLLQDPYANYVIQSALGVTKGHLNALLVEAVSPHAVLRTSPYCKRIFSRNVLKK
ncbi:putative pumilio homolog 7, chloroplastic isoform X2 [Tripterygium wilfordii]|uniref:putative pumilio homolog 7, chloroplastic isoform X2 n=1 Tax=Tripterygium wilfordii TaxID=458696 RepID=UPI0018F82C56|nr:putative pumilio homolog 7, chloroplastic isoform X2 [Tripterygium wilfordii]